MPWATQRETIAGVKPLILIAAGALILGAGVSAQTVPELLLQERDYSVLSGDVFEASGGSCPTAAARSRPLPTPRREAHSTEAVERPHPPTSNPRGMARRAVPLLGFRLGHHRPAALAERPRTRTPTLAIIHGGSANW